MAAPDPFAAPQDELVGPLPPYRMGAALWTVTWPVRVVWANVFVWVWYASGRSGPASDGLPFVEVVCGVGLILGAWIVCGAFARRYVPALLFSATVRLGLLATGRFEDTLPTLDACIDVLSALALASACRQLGRRALARFALLGAVVPFLAVVVDTAQLESDHYVWPILAVVLAMVTWATVQAGLFGVLVGPPGEEPG